jgi:rhamnosyltransferase
MPKVSLIIRTKNEERYIGETLGKVFFQNYKDFEVIIVDSGSKDRTLEIINKFNVRILRITPQEFSYGYALNFGIKNAISDVIVSLSAHAIPANNKWLENLIAPLKDAGVIAVYGRQLPDFNCSPIEKKDLIETYGEKKKIQTQDVTFSNSNSAIKKKAWEKFPFDEGMSFAEDIHWSKQVLESGYAIVYEPEAAVYHSHAHSLKEIYLRELNRHRGRLQRKHIFKVKNLISLFLEGVKGDMLFCIKGKESLKWLFYIPIYHLVLLSARCKIQIHFFRVNIRKRLKKFRLLRRVYNSLLGLYRYRRERLKYNLMLLVESMKNCSDVRDILLARTFGIGDIIRTTPIIEKLKKKFCNAKIYYFTYKRNLPLVFFNPYINRCYSEEEIEELLKKEYDLVINWQIFDDCIYTKRVLKNIKAKRILGRHFDTNGNYYFDTTLHLRTWMEMFCKIALVPYYKQDPQKVRIYFSSNKDKGAVLKKFNLNGKERYVGICMGGNESGGSEYWYRNFSIDFFKDLIRELSIKYKLILVGKSKDRDIEEREKLKTLNGHPNLLNLIDRLKLEELMAVIDNCDCFISSDTGPLHIAMALGVPVVAVFSNNTGGIYISPKKRGRYYSILYNAQPNCFPCEQLFEEECLESRRARCIEGIPISKIIKEVDRCITLR